MNFLIINTATIALGLTVYFNVYIASKALYFIYCWAFFLLQCGFLILLPNGLQKCFGIKNMPLCYGLIQLFGVS